MQKRPAVLAVLAVLATAFAFAIATAPGAQAATPVRIMPLGDSITGSPGCWRALLWNRLQSTGYTNIDMVGTLGPQGCSVAYDGDNEGHGGALVTAVADQNQLVGWLATARPDIVVMHFGTNDVWSNRSTDQILTAYSKLVDQMRASNANMRILVAQIIPVAPSSCTECPTRTVALNNAIPGWAASKTTAQSPITVVNQWAGWTPATLTSDGVHPNAAGDQRMSDTWYPALAAALNGTTPPATTPPVTTPPVTTPPVTTPPVTTPPVTTPPVTTPPVTTPPVTTPPPAGVGCTVAYTQVGSNWPGGFQGQVTVKNTGTTPTTGWRVTLTFGNGQRITQLWGGRTTSTASPYLVTNETYNGVIGAGASVTFGFLGSWTGTNAAPAATCSRTP